MKLSESVNPCLYTLSKVLENIFNISFSNKFNFIVAPPLIRLYDIFVIKIFHLFFDFFSIIYHVFSTFFPSFFHIFSILFTTLLGSVNMQSKGVIRNGKIERKSW